jgi:hypothetical protein
MKKLIYYKIETKNGITKERNVIRDIEGKIMSYEELKAFNRAARSWENTYHAPIILNMMDIKD